MKKVLSLALALTLIFAMAIPAMAANETSGSTTVSTSIDQTYTIQIPATTVISFNSLSTDLIIGLTAARLEPNHHVTFTATPNGTLKNAADNNKTIAYSIMDGANTFSSVNFTSVSTKTLKIDIAQAAWDSAAAGSYTDTITFTVSYGEPTP